jgi:hypothetical protein
MRLSIKGFTLAGAATFGIIMLLMGVVALIKPTWGQEFMAIVGVVHPGANGVAVGSVLISVVYAVIHGGFSGALFAWLHNLFVGGRMP